MTDAAPIPELALTAAHRAQEPERGPSFSLRAACSCGWRGQERRGARRQYAKRAGFDFQRHLAEKASERRAARTVTP